MPTTPMLGAADRKVAQAPHRTPRQVRRTNRATERAAVCRETARYIRASRRSQP